MITATAASTKLAMWIAVPAMVVTAGVGTAIYTANDAAGDKSEQEWQYALGVLKGFHDSSRKNIHAEVFAAQAYALGQHCYAGRTTWAGDFTRGALVATARDLEARPHEWTRPSTSEEFGHTLERLASAKSFARFAEWLTAFMGVTLFDLFTFQYDNLDNVAAVAASLLEGSIKGMRHVDEQLQPFFIEYLGRELRNAAKATDKLQSISAKIQAIQTEHEALITNAAEPAIREVFSGLPELQAPTLEIVPASVRKLRRETLQSTVKAMAQEGLITAEEESALVGQIQ